MKYVILIHSHPEPWGHPTADFLPEPQMLSNTERERLGQEFEVGFDEMLRRGELIHAQPLAAPTSARLFRWQDGNRVTAVGPYSAGPDHFAGFFVIDVASQQRAEEIATFFCGPGETVELRPIMATE